MTPQQPASGTVLQLEVDGGESMSERPEKVAGSGKSEKDTRTLLERAAAWNRGEFDAFPQPEDPDDVTLAQPKRPTRRVQHDEPDHALKPSDLDP